MERHQKIATVIAAAIFAILSIRDGIDLALSDGLLLLMGLLPIVLYRWIAYFSSFGFPEVFAKDYGTENHPAPYAFFFWLLFLLLCLALLFGWQFQ
ncbi:MAG: hypothetical protein L3J28_14910 [Candidatus Polarisedimenticolaceae bacterium]|nr:hypothetical protein [Candidatus Polarisedimenticolaceae bacterium]